MDVKLIKVPPQTIDDFGDVVKLRDAFAPTERLYQRLLSQLKEACVSQDPNKEYSVEGTRYRVLISACKFESQVDVPRARKKLGVEKFLEACTVTLKGLSNFLPRPEVEALTISVQTSSRSYNPVAIAEKASGAGV